MGRRVREGKMNIQNDYKNNNSENEIDNERWEVFNNKYVRIIVITLSVLIILYMMYITFIRINTNLIVDKLYTYTTVTELQENNDKALKWFHKDTKHLVDVDNISVLYNRYADLRGKPTKLQRYTTFYKSPRELWIVGILNNQYIKEDVPAVIRVKWKWFKITEYEDWILEEIVKDREYQERTYPTY